jgi:hypothetical protein
MRKKFHLAVFAVAAAAGPFAPPVFSAGEAAAPAAPAPISMPQDPARRRMMDIMEELKNAKTPEQREAARARLEQAREQYRASHPVKELTPAEKEARRRELEEQLKKDPYRWRMYQLQQAMLDAKTKEERESLRAQLNSLRDARAAEAEAKLTPEQKAERQARQEKNARMQAELKPLMERMHEAKTDYERGALRVQVRDVIKKYR